MFKILFGFLWHFVNRPDKILLTMVLPLIMILTLDVSENLENYRDFMFDR
jgi:hypothetical protein